MNQTMQRFSSFLNRIEPIASQVRFYLLFCAVTSFGVLWVLAHHSEIQKVQKAYMLRTLVEVYSSDGQRLGRIRASTSGRLVAGHILQLKEIPDFAIQAVLLSEDKRFYSHLGVDPIATINALRSLDGGGSGISQQLARKEGLTAVEDEAEKKSLQKIFGAKMGGVIAMLPRKVDEALFSLVFNRTFSKDEILYYYLNTAYWGGSDDESIGIYGIGAASQAYFGINAAQLTRGQAFYLSALLTAPQSHYFDFERARKGVKQRLSNFVRAGFLSAAQAQAIWLEPIQPIGWKVKYNQEGELLEQVRVGQNAIQRFRPLGDLGLNCVFDTINEALKDQYQVLPEGVLSVQTTIDSRLQKAARVALTAGLAAESMPDNGEFALTAVDPYTGEIRVLTTTRPCNMATTDSSASDLLRQPASTIKPLLLATAFESGIATPWSLYKDSPMSGYGIQNYVGRQSNKKMMLREALNRSLNLPFLRLARDIGFARVHDQLEKLGVNVPTQLNASHMIGGGEVAVTNLQLAAIYASFANGGTLYRPNLIKTIEIVHGHRNQSPKLIYQHKPRGKSVWSAETAYMTLNMLCGVMTDPARINPYLARGANTVANSCGKTGSSGTAKQAFDFWYAGLTPNLAGVLWLGNANNQPLNSKTNSGFNAMLYGKFLETTKALGALPNAEYARPPTITAKRVGGVWMAAVGQ
jgi:penicillin-binding protein 1A